MRILITRPAEDGGEIAARLTRRGHHGVVAPLLVPHYGGGPEPDLTGVQAILITSANGVRALIRATARRDIAIYAVGPQTTKEAREAGFTNVRNADGNARDLAARTCEWTTPAKGALLHVCGSDAPGTLGALLHDAGFTVVRAPLYRIEAATALPAAVIADLRAGAFDGAMFFSPRSAAIFRDLLPEARLAAGLTALTISAETAAALAPLPFAAIRIAARPNQDAMLALVE